MVVQREARFLPTRPNEVWSLDFIHDQLSGGTKFRARFQVAAPAQVPTAGGPAPDPTPVYSGTGSFITANTRVQAE